ncbi:MAG TPA: glutamine synthetase family protein [Pseudonocardiaceae bacterium]|jgi:glutamine synthetase|nr:glutamine synthetase family protein [Pseudonocardiaceae bacterium]
MDDTARRAAAERARSMRPELGALGVKLVALTWVDNSGITRTKAVPLERLDSAAAWGVGASPCFDTFLFNDVGMTSGVVGDLRLHPDLSRLTVLAAQPGWAWAPADRYDQDGTAYSGDQRGLAHAAVHRLAERGYTAKAAFEVEWVVGEARDDIDGADFRPAAHGPAYGYARLVSRSDYVRDVAVALADQGVSVDQIHPEYSPGQFEVSVAAADPVGAADDYVLVRETIRAVSHRHGLRASFAPKVVAEGVGNGGHVHLSVWDGDRNLYSGGDGRFGLTAQGESFAAGILDRLPALLAIGAPSVASYLRLRPQHWAGAFAVWGLENREAAVRLVLGPPGSREWAANMETKCFDQSANPYLVVASLIFAGLAGLGTKATLPDPLDVDPALLADEERRRRGIRQLPGSLSESTEAFAEDPMLAEAFGERLTSDILAVRRGEIEHFAGASPDDVVAALRWVH